MSVFEMIEGVHFDCAAESIRCRADRDGAEIITVDVEQRIVNVLAHTNDEAIYAARHHVADYLHAEIL